MRNLLSEVYFGKTKDVINELRSAQGLQVKKTQDDMRRELMGALGARRG
jgi:capping protein beta